MQQEKPIWKILTLVVAALGVAASVFFHFDTKASTEKKIVEVLSNRYSFVDKEMSWEHALEAVDKDIQKLQEDNATLLAEKTELNKKIDSANKAQERSEKMKLAESYAASGEYSVAIPILEGISEKTNDVRALLKNYTTTYESSIVAEAEKLAESGKFEEAKGKIDEALKIVPNSQVLLKKKEGITPRYLTETIECYKAKDLWRLDPKEYIKMNGKSYRYAIYTESSNIAINLLNGAYDANAFYNLDGEYSQLTGIVGHIDFSGSGTIGQNDSGQVYDAEITIWGDNKELKTITLLSNDTAKEFNVSVSGVKILEFRVKCAGNSKVGLAELQIR